MQFHDGLMNEDGVECYPTPAKLYAGGAAFRAFYRLKNQSRRLDVGGLLALGALCHFKADLLAFFEGLEAVHVDCGKMREQIIAAIIGSDKTKTLRIVKPFNCTGCHVIILAENGEISRSGTVAHCTLNALSVFA
jgi:hypothetical protein